MSTPFINFLVSDMRAMDLSEESSLFHVVQMLAVGRGTSTGEQISEICHSILAPQVRRDILYLTRYPFHHMRWEEKEIMGRLILPPSSPEDLIKNIAERNFLRTGLNYCENKEVRSLYKILHVKQDLTGGFGIDPAHMIDPIITAWIWYRVFPHLPVTSMGIFKLCQILKTGVKGDAETDPIAVEILTAADDEKDLIKAIQQLAPFLAN